MPRISRIEVRNFKSLVDFTIDLPKFTCLIGLNGSGKSTVLQFIDFLSGLAHGDMNLWLHQRQWQASDLQSKVSKGTDIHFRIDFADDAHGQVGYWEATYDPKQKRCIKERLQASSDVLNVANDFVTTHQPSPGKSWAYPITFEYEGSILSALKPDLLPPGVLLARAVLRAVKSLDLLTPDYLRQLAYRSAEPVGLGGRHFAAVLHNMDDRRRIGLNESLKKVYPRLQYVIAQLQPSGRTQIQVSEKVNPQAVGYPASISTDANHISDGMLRLMVILAELQSEHSFLLFDEIENGINPELVEFVLDELVASPKQVMVTTHSPMILNYLDDDVVRQGVVYLYKTIYGKTKSIPFFSIPSLAEKLKVMGPGEAFVDTNLTALGAEIEAMTETR